MWCRLSPHEVDPLRSFVHKTEAFFHFFLKNVVPDQGYFLNLAFPSALPFFFRHVKKQETHWRVLFLYMFFLPSYIAAVGERKQKYQNFSILR